MYIADFIINPENHLLQDNKSQPPVNRIQNYFF